MSSVQETFSLLFLCIIVNALDVAAVLLEAGASADDLADLVVRAHQHAVQAAHGSAGEARAQGNRRVMCHRV